MIQTSDFIPNFAQNDADMNKLLLLSLLALTSLNLGAQCTPDPTQTEPGIYPDSATGFADACMGIYYEQLITNIVPADTNVLVFGIPILTSIDSVVIDSLNGLPPGMSFECNPNSCVFPGGETGCAIITGICSVVGDYPLTFYLSAYVGGVSSPNPYLVDYYTINVSACTAGIEENELAHLKLSPNPALNNVTIEGFPTKKGIKSISLMNLEGKTIRNIAFDQQSEVIVPLDGVNSGIYFIGIHTVDGNEVLKLVKE